MWVVDWRSRSSTPYTLKDNPSFLYYCCLHDINMEKINFNNLYNAFKPLIDKKETLQEFAMPGSLSSMDTQLIPMNNDMLATNAPVNSSSMAQAYIKPVGVFGTDQVNNHNKFNGDTTTDGQSSNSSQNDPSKGDLDQVGELMKQFGGDIRNVPDAATQIISAFDWEYDQQVKHDRYGALKLIAKNLSADPNYYNDSKQVVGIDEISGQPEDKPEKRETPGEIDPETGIWVADWIKNKEKDLPPLPPKPKPKKMDLGYEGDPSKNEEVLKYSTLSAEDLEKLIHDIQMAKYGKTYYTKKTEKPPKQPPVEKKPKDLEENSFEAGVSGGSGQLNYGQMYGTPSGGNITQNPRNFATNTSANRANKEDANINMGNDDEGEDNNLTSLILALLRRSEEQLFEACMRKKVPLTKELLSKNQEFVMAKIKSGGYKKTFNSFISMLKESEANRQFDPRDYIITKTEEEPVEKQKQLNQLSVVNPHTGQKVKLTYTHPKTGVVKPLTLEDLEDPGVMKSVNLQEAGFDDETLEEMWLDIANNKKETSTSGRRNYDGEQDITGTRNKLTKEDVKAIRRNTENTDAELGERYRVSTSTISAVRSGKTWGWLEEYGKVKVKHGWPVGVAKRRESDSVVDKQANVVEGSIEGDPNDPANKKYMKGRRWTTEFDEGDDTMALPTEPDFGSGFAPMEEDDAGEGIYEDEEDEQVKIDGQTLHETIMALRNQRQADNVKEIIESKLKKNYEE